MHLMLDEVVMLRVGIDKIFQGRSGDTFHRLAWLSIYWPPLNKTTMYYSGTSQKMKHIKRSVCACLTILLSTIIMTSLFQVEDDTR